MKKLMALLLSVIMIVTFMPAMAFAGDDEGYDELEPGKDQFMVKTSYNDGGTLTLSSTPDAIESKQIRDGHERKTIYDNETLVDAIFLAGAGYFLESIKLRYEDDGEEVYERYDAVSEHDDVAGTDEFKGFFLVGDDGETTDKELTLTEKDGSFIYSYEKNADIDIEACFNNGDFDGFEPDSDDPAVYMVESSMIEHGSIDIGGSIQRYEESIGKEPGKKKATFAAKLTGTETGGAKATITFRPDKDYRLDQVKVRIQEKYDEDESESFTCEYDDGSFYVDGEEFTDIKKDNGFYVYTIKAIEQFGKVYIEAEFIDDGKYETRLSINGATSYNTLPDEEFVLKAELLRNGKPVTKDVRYELNWDENNIFDHDDNPAIDFGDVLETSNGEWNCRALPFYDNEEEPLIGGYADFSVKACYNGEEHFSEKVDVFVECHLGYGNRKITTDENHKHLDVSLADVTDAGIVIDPYCNGKDLSFDFQVGYNEGNTFNPISDCGKKSGNSYSLTKNDIYKAIQGHDPGFVVKVIGKGNANIGGTTKEVVYASEEVVIDVELETASIYEQCSLTFPSCIPYEEGKTVYDIIDQFHVFSKTGAEIAEDRDKTFEWRFVNANPDTLSTLELGEAASVVVNRTSGNKPGNEYFRDYSVNTNPSTYGLKLDSLGTYWVVAAGANGYGISGGEYNSFLIGSFELVDSEYYYDVRPSAIENLTYEDKNKDNQCDAIPLINGGTPNKGKIQYSLDGVNYIDSVPTAQINAGSLVRDYTVYYKIVDGNDDKVGPETINVTIKKKPIHVLINDVTKNYGAIDPELSVDSVVMNKDELPKIVADNIKFSRVAGEAIDTEQGYPIYALLKDDNYEVVVSDGRLFVEKANYNLSIVDTVSFAQGTTCTVAYNTNHDNITVTCIEGENSKLTATVNAGVLKITSTEPCSEDLKLTIDGDDNHNGVEKIIHVDVTSVAITSGNTGSVAAKSDNETDLNGFNLSVEPKTDTTVDITLDDGHDNEPEYSEGTSLVVKVKLDGTLAGLASGTDPVAKCGDEEYPAWFEYVGDDTYLCFETSHLSTWKFSTTPAISLGSNFRFNVPSSITMIGSGPIDLGENVLVDTNGDPVDPSCYELLYKKDSDGYSTTPISEPGTYKVKAQAIKGMGYTGSVEIKTPFTVIGAHSHNYVAKHNSQSHWEECSVDGCNAIKNMSKHEFKAPNYDIGEKVGTGTYTLARKATCIELAKYYKHCECGADSTETFSDLDSKLTDHSYSSNKIDEVAATEDTHGRKEYYKCTGCGASFDKDGKVLTNDDLIIHYLTKVEAKAATKTEDGNVEYWECSVCNKYFKDSTGTQEYGENEWVIPATGGGGDPVTPVDPTKPEDDIDVDPTTGEITADIGGEAKISEGTASAVITADTAADIAKSITENKSTEVKLDATVKESVDKTELEIPMVIADAADANGASVEIATNVGSIVLDKQTIKGIAKEDADSFTIAVEKTAESGTDKAVFDITLTVVKDGNSTTISKLQGTAQVVAPLPSGLEAKEACGLYLNGKLAEKVTTKVDGKNVVLTVKHFSTYGIMSNDAANKLFKKSAEATTMGKLTLKTYKGGKIKASWKNGTGNTANITKYQVYYKQSGKKAKYTTTTSKSKTIKKLKKGKKYTVKTRAYIKINGKTYKSKWTSAKKIKCR